MVESTFKDADLIRRYSLLLSQKVGVGQENRDAVQCGAARSTFLKKSFNRAQKERRARCQSHVQLKRDQILYKILNFGVQPTNIILSMPHIIVFVVYFYIF